MAVHNYIWLLSIVPVVLTSYFIPLDSHNLETGDVRVLIRDLVEEVRALKVMAERQGEIIETQQAQIRTLENQVSDLEAIVSQVNHPDTDENDVVDTSASHEAESMTAEEGNQPNEHDKAEIGPRNTVSKPNLRGRRSTSQQIAFSAYLDQGLTDISIGSTVRFNQVLINDGNDYNVHTGVFTAPLNGVYFFIFYIHDYRDRAKVKLVVDGTLLMNGIVSTPTDGADITGGNTAIVRVNAGQSVWVETCYYPDADLRSGVTNRLVTFSGFRIY